MSAVVVGAGKGVQALPLLVFAVVLSITLGVTFWAARRTRTATDFWAAGRGISGLQNGLAIAGDYMSAAAFLGVSGLIFLFGNVAIVKWVVAGGSVFFVLFMMFLELFVAFLQAYIFALLTSVLIGLMQREH